MSGDFPEEWFRPHPAEGDHAPDEPPAAPAGGGSSSPDERYTDQFKPGYLAHQPAQRTAAQQHTDPGRSVRAVESPVTSTGPGAVSVGALPAVEPEPEPAPRRRGRGLAAVAVLGVVLAAGIGIGHLISNRGGTSTSDPQATSAPLASASDSAAASTSPASPTPSASAQPWKGAVRTVAADGVTASCTAPPQAGYDGRTVPSSARRVLDDSLSTGWRCDGAAVGQTLRFTFPKGTRVVGVRMTNGYTKSVGGTPLYPQYRRVTEVTWTFPGADDAYFTQKLADDNPRLQEIRIPATSTDGGLTMEVTQTTSPGTSESTRDAVVVTEVQFLARND